MAMSLLSSKGQRQQRLGCWKVCFIVAALFMSFRLIRVGVKTGTDITNLDAPFGLVSPRSSSTSASIKTTTTSSLSSSLSSLLLLNVTNNQSKPLFKPSPMVADESGMVWVVWKNRTVTPVPDAIQFFYNEIRSDRSGAMIVDMLMAHAYSWLSGRKYGGVCGKSQLHSPDHRRMIQALALERELPYPERLLACHNINKSVAWVLPRNAYNRKDTGIFTTEWIQYMRRQQQQIQRRKQEENQQQVVSAVQPLQTLSYSSSSSSSSTPERHRIIVYIRRGDVTPCIVANFRYLPNWHYLTLIDQYTTTITHNHSQQQADVLYNITIYSQSDSFESWEDFDRHFQNRTNIEYHLALDGDMGQVWRDMMGWNDPEDRRDGNNKQDHDHAPSSSSSSSYYSRVVFILSRSAFGLVPAMFAKPTTVVVYTPEYFHQPLPHWHVIPSSMLGHSYARVAKLRREQCPKQQNNNSLSSSTTTTTSTTTTVDGSLLIKQQNNILANTSGTTIHRSRRKRRMAPSVNNNTH